MATEENLNVFNEIHIINTWTHYGEQKIQEFLVWLASTKNADNKNGYITFSYTNVDGNKKEEHIHAPCR